MISPQIVNVRVTGQHRACDYCRQKERMEIKTRSEEDEEDYRFGPSCFWERKVVESGFGLSSVQGGTAGSN